MARKTLAEWSLVTRDQKETHVMAENIKAAVEIIDTELSPVYSARRIQGDVVVEVPEMPVKFKTVVEGAEAEVAGCVAYPELYTVPANSKVIFTAVPGEGYRFVNWTRGVETLSEDAVAEIEIKPLEADEPIAEIKANFVLG